MQIDVQVKNQTFTKCIFRILRRLDDSLPFTDNRVWNRPKLECNDI